MKINITGFESRNQVGVHYLKYLFLAARDLASSGIRVCCIAPGVIRTPIMEKVGISEEQMKEICKIIPFPQRSGDPAYFADLVCTVIDNPYLNGETIRLDGAARM